jgi:hypothetical protein
MYPYSMDQQHEYILNTLRNDTQRAEEYTKRYIVRFCPQIEEEIKNTKKKIDEVKIVHALKPQYAFEIYQAGLEHYLKSLEYIQQNMCRKS